MVDLENAYNRQCRAEALEQLATPAPSLESFLRQFYGTASQYFYRTSRTSHTIVSASEGIEQGDAAGPALFACGLKTPLDELRNELGSLLTQEQTRREVTGCVSVFAYLDDTIVGVPAELAGAALPLAVATFARAGHTVHPGKSACWSHSGAPDALPDVYQNIWNANGLKVEGNPVFNAEREPILMQEML